VFHLHTRWQNWSRAIVGPNAPSRTAVKMPEASGVPAQIDSRRIYRSDGSLLRPEDAPVKEVLFDAAGRADVPI
jgi:hypothetical protein